MEQLNKNVCTVCDAFIKMMAFKNTGQCCENHRKIASKEIE